eukprot:9285482-Ditylum_brightwellii.AAC.1
MAKSGKKVQWPSRVQNHQNRHPLPVLDAKVSDYEAIPTVDIGDKAKNFVIKLHEMHGKEKFTIFTEAGKRTELETFPNKAPEINTFLDYEV